MKIRIAFASTDGAYIDQHFGSAHFFQIYDLDGAVYEPVESRRTMASCQGNCEGGFDHLYEALKDCDAVFVLRIGQSAAAYMIGRGKRVFEAYGAVDDILEQVLAGNLLEQG